MLPRPSVRLTFSHLLVRRSIGAGSYRPCHWHSFGGAAGAFACVRACSAPLLLPRVAKAIGGPSQPNVREERAHGRVGGITAVRGDEGHDNLLVLGSWGIGNRHMHGNITVPFRSIASFLVIILLSSSLVTLFEITRTRWIGGGGVSAVGLSGASVGWAAGPLRIEMHAHACDPHHGTLEKRAHRLEGTWLETRPARDELARRRWLRCVWRLLLLCFVTKSNHEPTSGGGEGRRQDCSCCRCVKSPLASHPTPRRPTQARPLLFLFWIALPLRRARPFVSWTWTQTCMIMRAHSLVSPPAAVRMPAARRGVAVAVAWQQAGLQEHRRWRWRWRIGMCRWAYRQVTSRVRPMASGTLRAENDGSVPQPFLSRD